MTKILAFGSFKQSGKSSSCEFINQYILNAKSIYQLPEGMDMFNQEFEGWKYSRGVKIYSFADKLKQFAVECLGLSEAQCYGTDDDKNSLTHLKWEDMPGIISDKSIWDGLYNQGWLSEDIYTSWTLIKYLSYHAPGFMTSREVLQYFGTGICRKMYSNVWVDSCLRQIKKDNLDFALLADCRFKNEAKAVQEAGGKIIGFMRRPFPNDTHQSEIDLIGYPFDATIDNTDLSLEDKNNKVLGLLKDWKWL